MSNFRAEKVLALPGTLVANTVYFVADADDGDLLQVHVSSSDATESRRIPTMLDINAAINAVVTAANGVAVTATIATLNGVGFDVNGPTKMVLVLDASDDATVASGAATYVNSGGVWVKIAEHESMDVVLNWASIQNGPTSTVAAIDQAVTDSHTHSNKTVLDKFTEVGGALTYDGDLVATQVSEVEW